MRSLLSRMSASRAFEDVASEVVMIAPCIQE
jgi:hypothetical protein